MSIWKDENGTLHDDDDGAALSLPGWPEGMTKLTDAEADELQNPQPTTEQLSAAVRAKRDALIAAIAWRVERYQSEVRHGLTPTDDIAVLDAYIQALRDITEQSTFPGVVWPEVPA